MTHNRKFKVEGTNIFKSAVPLEEIKKDLQENQIPYLSDKLVTKQLYDFFINDSSEPLKLRLVCSKAELAECLTLQSEDSFDFPKVDFDHPVSYGVGCGSDDIQYNFDFEKNVIFITGSDIYGSLGLRN